jgi:integrase
MEKVSGTPAGTCNGTRLRRQKPPLKAKEIWAIRIRLQLAKRIRDLALFNLAIDSKLRGCDLVALKVYDIAPSGVVASRAIVMQRQTQRQVQFEITDQTRESLAAWIAAAGLRRDQSLFPGRIASSPHISTRQYARIVRRWVSLIGLEPSTCGTHSMRRTKATLIYRRTRNIRAVQLPLRHTKPESTVRYLGIEVDDALEISEQTEARDVSLVAVDGRIPTRSGPAIQFSFVIGNVGGGRSSTKSTPRSE